MKKLCSIALIFVLTATLLVGCGCTMISTDPTTNPSDASSSTRPTVMPKPEVPMPSGTNTTAPADGSNGDGSSPDGAAGVPGRMMRPSPRSPRY